MKQNYFSLAKSKDEATINIYGDITHYPFLEGDVSARNLSAQLESLTDVSQINVYINSYGGHVSEGIAIYNALKRHKAKIKTICDGFACSIASVVFCAGDERVMNKASALMIHNAWSEVEGDANELRKQADDLEKLTQLSVEIYKEHSSLTEEEIKALMDAETWILSNEALKYGIATTIEENDNTKANQSARNALFEMVKAYQTKEADETEETPDDDTEETTTEDSKEDSEEEKVSEATQKWSGFFSAILKF